MAAFGARQRHDADKPKGIFHSLRVVREAVGRIWQALCAYVNRRLPERRIYIRSDGDVRYLVISTRTQAVTVTAVSALMVWTVFASYGLAVRSHRLAGIEQEIAGLHLAYQVALTQAAVNAAQKLEVANSGGVPVATLVSEKAQAVPTASGAPAVGGDLPPNPNTVLAEDAPLGRKLKPNDPENLRRRVSQLENALSEMQALQVQVLNRVTNIASNITGDIEKAISLTGLDPAKLAARKAEKAASVGRGGPYVPSAMAPFASQEMRATLAALNLKIGRFEDASRLMQSLPLASPLERYEINSNFGARSDPFNDLPGIHEGVDLGAPRRSPVRATAAGRVTAAAWKGRYGRMVEIDHGNGIRTRYAHLDKILVSVGEKVDTRTQVGLLGNSGRSSGPHLHYEVLVSGTPRDPMRFLKAGKNVFKKQQQNSKAG